MVHYPKWQSQEKKSLHVAKCTAKQDSEMSAYTGYVQMAHGENQSNVPLTILIELQSFSRTYHCSLAVFFQWTSACSCLVHSFYSLCTHLLSFHRMESNIITVHNLLCRENISAVMRGCLQYFITHVPWFLIWRHFYNSGHQNDAYLCACVSMYLKLYIKNFPLINTWCMNMPLWDNFEYYNFQPYSIRERLTS